MNSLGSNHSVPSTSVSSQSSSVSSMQEVLDDSLSDMTATQPLDYGSLESCAHAKKVRGQGGSRYTKPEPSQNHLRATSSTPLTVHEDVTPFKVFENERV